MHCNASRRKGHALQRQQLLRGCASFTTVTRLQRNGSDVSALTWLVRSPHCGADDFELRPHVVPRACMRLQHISFIERSARKRHAPPRDQSSMGVTSRCVSFYSSDGVDLESLLPDVWSAAHPEHSSSTVTMKPRRPRSRVVAVGSDAGPKPRNTAETPEMAAVLVGVCRAPDRGTGDSVLKE